MWKLLPLRSMSQKLHRKRTIVQMLSLKRTGRFASIELTVSLPIHLAVMPASELTSASMETVAIVAKDEDIG